MVKGSSIRTHISTECPAMPAASGNRIPTSTAVQLPSIDGNTRALSHLGAPALALECTKTGRCLADIGGTSMDVAV